eukprot:SAG31_NODE_879_length_11292_cov_49.116680_9_plen_36_part_00
MDLLIINCELGGSYLNSDPTKFSINKIVPTAPVQL